MALDGDVLGLAMLQALRSEITQAGGKDANNVEVAWKAVGQAIVDHFKSFAEVTIGSPDVTSPSGPAAQGHTHAISPTLNKIR